jgi:IS4 transposase
VFATNNLQWAATTTARLHQGRWQVEPFFKWTNQHHKMKSFLGTSLNAVMTLLSGLIQI